MVGLWVGKWKAFVSLSEGTISICSPTASSSSATAATQEKRIRSQLVVQSPAPNMCVYVDGGLVGSGDVCDVCVYLCLSG